ncbi:MAG: hypothetical protein JOZ78_09285 [Chroococcidiopsidaceae cyanobacterium CP_BM_ER_R8_30]|nr:hypothetical protein [Chroococcidiopsidaceae cyanobacterium CP_BM_ER_R8_30]
MKNDIQLDLIEVFDFYIDQRYNELSEVFIKFLRAFESTTYIQLLPEDKYNLNLFLKNFLYFFTQPDYVLSEQHMIKFIELNPIISNLAAISSFKTTDAYIEILIHQPNSLAKILALYSARNTFKINRRELFNANPQLACYWYSYFYEIFSYGLINKEVNQNLREHMQYKDIRLINFYQLTPIYFGATYIDNSLDREVKQTLNQTIKNSRFCTGIQIKNTPYPRKIAIVTSFWFPRHSVYRTLSKYVESLKNDYDMTLIHLGEERDDLDVSYFKEVQYVNIVNNSLNTGSLRENNFIVVFYPDVGMTQESIFLSNLRLAPIQVCGTGHPVSTFGSEIDFFISGVDVEIPEGAESNYSERLVLLPGYGLIHNQPNYQIKNAKKSRPEFIINCAWHAHKINYQLISYLQEIVRGSKRDIVFRLFLGGALSQKNCIIPFAKDLDAFSLDTPLCKGQFDLILDLPYEKYMALMEEGDLCIDSYHFGGSNIIADSLYLRKPTVTFQGDKWYNRIGSQMLRTVGLEELIATNAEEYIRLTLKLIHEDQYRMDIQRKLKQVNLGQTIFNTNSQEYFKKTIDFLINNHEQLKCSDVRDPLLIK